VLREPQTLSGKPIHIRRRELLLTVTGEITVTRIVQQDIDDIRLNRFRPQSVENP
jgi:hypothetical protein